MSRSLGVWAIFGKLSGVPGLQETSQLSGFGPPRGAAPKRRTISTLLMVAGLLVILYPALTEAYGYVVQTRLSREWDKELARQEQLAAAAGVAQREKIGSAAVTSEDAVLNEAAGSVKTTAPLEFPATKIKIPKIGVEQVVLDDVGPEFLKNGPGHYRGTPNPGERGTVGIAGHRVTYTHPFNRLDELHAGDPIILETLDNIFEYRVVRSETLEPDDLSALAPKKDGRARLTLTTCTPKYSARFRLDVQASLVKTTPRNRPTIFNRFVTNIVPKTPDELPQGVVELALKGAREDAAVNPRDAEARVRLGALYRKIGRYDDALTQLRLAAKLDENNARAYFETGLTYKRMRNIDPAISAFIKAANIDPGLEEAHYRLGELYLYSDRPARATDALLRALALNPLSGDTHFLLGKAFERLGETERAREAYANSLRYIPDLLEAKTALRRLDKPVD